MIGLILALAVVGFLVYLIVNFIPMPPPFKTGILVVVVICLIYYLLNIFGFADIPLPRAR